MTKVLALFYVYVDDVIVSREDIARTAGDKEIY